MTDTEFDTKFDYYETVREELGLRAIWSIYEIDNLSERHPYKGVTHLAYEDWSGKSIVSAINVLLMRHCLLRQMRQLLRLIRITISLRHSLKSLQTHRYCC